jgi:hypothetical protein
MELRDQSSQGAVGYEDILFHLADFLKMFQEKGIAA